MSIVIKADGLGKKYLINHQGKKQSYSTLRDSISNIFKKRAQSLTREEFWALKNIYFEINKGDKIGIIGRNGAGKSTLLKILSRITEPTTGKVGIKGRVASLLEVGTGFHPELTGRENIYLNGSILGMSHREIKRKFDEIVEFAGVEKFLDTPVKRYSSGMYVRLAFSVAAHLESEILIIDEVLAVGDAEFQKKCMGKMEDVSIGEGKTILFVSHNMAAIKSFCNKGILLENGSSNGLDDIHISMHNYYESLKVKEFLLSEISLKNSIKIIGIDFNLLPKETDKYCDHYLNSELIFYTPVFISNVYINYIIEDMDGNFLIHSRTDSYGKKPSFKKGLHKVKIEIPTLNLKSGIYNYWFRIYISNGENELIIDSEKLFLEINGPIIGGIINTLCNWSWESID